MLTHFCPRLLTPVGSDLPCELVDIRTKGLDLHLLSGRDVVARHPLPDKRYHVAYCKFGCRAVDDLLVDVERHVPLLTMGTCWGIDIEVVLCHHVEYVVFDVEHDTVNDYTLLWRNEVPNYFLSQSTLAMQAPLIKLMRDDVLQTERQDVFRLPTLGSERLRQDNIDANQYLPSREQAFHVKAEQIGHGLARRTRASDKLRWPPVPRIIGQPRHLVLRLLYPHGTRIHRLE